MTNEERLIMIKRKLKEFDQDMTELYDFLEMLEALTTDKNTAARIREFMETKGVWEKIKK